jgi:hypothetical protein
MEFLWYHIEDGVARAYPDTREVRDRIDSDARGWYSNPEGCILHGGVKATAFKRTIEKTYDGPHWLKTNEMREVGRVMVTEITAASENTPDRRMVSHLPKED